MGFTFLLMKFTKKINYEDRFTIFNIRVWYSASMFLISFSSSR